MRQFISALKNLRPPSKKASAGALLFAAFFLLYALTHDRAYVFDSLLTALTIRRPLFGGPLSALLTWNHFLWLPFLRLFFLGLKAVGYSGSSYEAIQWWNTGVGALLIVFIYGFLAKFVHRGWALLLGCLAGVSHLLWLRSSSGDPYLTGTLLSVAACYLLTTLSCEPSLLLLTGIAFTGVMGVYLHIANIILLPVIAFTVAWRSGPRGPLNAAYVTVISAAMLVPYVLVFELTTLHGVKEWLVWGAGQLNGQMPGSSASGQFDLHLLKIIPIGFYTLLQSAAALRTAGTPVMLAATAGLSAAGAWCAVNRAGQKINRGTALPPLLFFITTAVFFSVWIPGNLFYWASPLVFFLLSAALLFSNELRSSPKLPASLAAGVLILSLGLLNFHRVIGPNIEGDETRPLITLCEGIEKNTPPGSAVMISGHYEGALKVGIPYFTGRQLLPLDLTFIQYYGTGRDPILVLQARLDAYFKRGVPVYMLGDVLITKGEFGPWGVTPGRIDALLSSYRLTEVARLTPAGPGALYRLEQK